MARTRAKIGGNPFYFAKEGFKNIIANGFMSFAALSIIALCILIVGCFGLISLNIEHTIQTIKDESQVRVFIEEDYTLENEDYFALEEELTAISGVSHLEYLSKEQSIEDFRETLGTNDYMLEGFEGAENPLRDGYIVFIEQIEDIDNITNELAEIKGIGHVQSDNEVLTGLSDLESGMRIISMALMIALGFVGIFIISNTVKLAMYSRREEIAIMKMIGAKNAFIVWPFIFEGMILGLIGSIIAFGVQWLIYLEFINISATYLGFVEIISFESILYYVLGAFLIVGTLMGILGSTLTIRKFLNV